MATVIRGAGIGSSSRDDAPRTADFLLSDMGRQGDRYVADVRAEAARIVQAAREEADAIRTAAAAEARATAEAEVDKQLAELIGREMQTVRPALDKVLGRLEAAHGEWLDHWRGAAVGVAVAIAERIVRRELASDPSISEEWLTEALRLAAGSSDVTVRLSPTDQERLRGHAEALAESLQDLGEARVVADEAIEPGDCVVETRHGVVDQRLATQLQRLGDELR